MNKLEFECSMDFPVLQLITNVKIRNANGSIYEKRFFVFYDYVLDSFFIKHPYQVNRGANSYVPNEFYEKAFNKCENRIETAVYDYLILLPGSEIKEIDYLEYYPYISSYKFVCEVEDEFKFDFDKLDLRNCNKKNIYVDDYNTIPFDLKQSIIELYDAELFKDALSHMAKMKFSYKSKNFKIEEDKYINLDTLEDNERLLLARDYFNNLNNEENIICVCNNKVKNDAKGKIILDLSKIDDYYENQIIILRNDGIYSYTPASLNTYIDIFEEYVDMYFTLETKLNKEDSKEIASKMLIEMSNSGNIDVNAITILTTLMN